MRVLANLARLGARRYPFFGNLSTTTFHTIIQNKLLLDLSILNSARLPRLPEATICQAGGSQPHKEQEKRERKG